MSLDNDRWGTAVGLAVATFVVPQDRVMTSEELTEIWKDITEAHITEFSGNADVAAGGFTAGGDPVTGTGGPVS